MHNLHFSLSNILSLVHQPEPNSSGDTLLSTVQDQQLHLVPLPGFMGSEHTLGSSAIVGDPTTDSPGFECPYCGLCSIDKFFSTIGCPKASSEQSRFPYLDFRQLKHNEKLNLEERLISDTKQMILRFGRLTRSAKRSFEKNGVSVEDVAGSVLCLGAFESDVGQKPLLQEHQSLITNANSLARIFLILTKYTSFFNYEIIQLLIEDLGTDEDKTRMKEYEAAFFEFCQRSVFEIPPHIYGQTLTHGKEHNVIVFKYTPSVATTLQAVRAIRSEIAKVLGLQPFSMQLCCVKKGCLELHFLIPAFMTDYVLASSESCSKALQDIGVRLVSPVSSPHKQNPFQEVPSRYVVLIAWSSYHGLQ